MLFEFTETGFEKSLLLDLSQETAPCEFDSLWLPLTIDSEESNEPTPFAIPEPGTSSAQLEH